MQVQTFDWINKINQKYKTNDAIIEESDRLLKSFGFQINKLQKIKHRPKNDKISNPINWEFASSLVVSSSHNKPILSKTKQNNQIDDTETTTSERETKMKLLTQKFQTLKLYQYFKIWFQNAYTLIQSQNKFESMYKFNLKLKVFTKWRNKSKEKINSQNSRIQKLEKYKNAYFLELEYVRSTLLKKYFMKWKEEKDKKLQIKQNDKPKNVKTRKYKTTKYKPPNFKQQKFIKKPPLPPIEVDPRMDELIKKTKESKENKLLQIKKQIISDAKERENKEKILKEKKQKERIEHIRNLQNENKQRQKNRKIEKKYYEEYIKQQNKENEANEFANFMLQKRFIHKWKTFIEFRKRQMKNSQEQFNNFIKNIYFNKMKNKFQIINERNNLIANNFYKKIFLNKMIKAPKIVKLELKKKEEKLEIVHSKFLLIFFFNEWKKQQIIAHRMKENKAINFYDKQLKKKVFKAFPIAINLQKEERKRLKFRDKMLEKAKQYLANYSSIKIQDIFFEEEEDEYF